MRVAPAVGLNGGSGDNCLVFLDYDNCSLTEAVKDAFLVKHALKLGPFEIVSTNKGFHAIFWWDAVNEATRDTAIEMSKADGSFKQKPKKTIRVGGKYEAADLQHIGVFKTDGDELSIDGTLKMQLAAKVGVCMDNLMAPSEGLSTIAPDES